MSIEDKIVDVVADVVADVDPFPVKPGGLIDSHRKAEEARKEAEEHRQDEGIAERAEKAVKVADLMPEGGYARTVIVQAGKGVVQLLGADETRRRAVVIALDKPVVLAADLAAASDSNNALAGTAAVNASGLVLPINVPLVLESRHEWWIVPTDPAAGRVSVLVETYAPEG